MLLALLQAEAGSANAAQLAEQTMTLAQFDESMRQYALALLIIGLAAALVHYRVLRRGVPHPTRLFGLRYPLWAQLIEGLLTAVIPLGLTLAPALAAGAYSASSPAWQPYGQRLITDGEPGAGQVWLFFGLAGSFEELLFRGLGMALLAALLAWLIRAMWAVSQPSATDNPQTARADDTSEERPEGEEARQPSKPQLAQVWFYSGLAANIVVSASFATVHRDNPEAGVLALLNIALAGLVLGQLYWLQGSLWGVCVMHGAWNAGLAMLGLPVSGWLLRGPVLGDIQGAAPGLLTGGRFGPEASLPCSIVLLLTWAWLVWRSRLLSQSA